MTYKDMTFCASLTCRGKCNRQLTKEDLKYLDENPWHWVSMREFCDSEGNPKDDLKRIDNETIQNKDK